MDERLHDRDRTWSYLKKALLRRYGERLDRAAAERRVNARRRGRGESYANFAAGLRKAAGRNRVSERVLLAQFYNCLELTVRALVKMAPKPKTLEEAVDKALEIDDRDENVALGLADIGHPRSLDDEPRMMHMEDDGEDAVVVPGIGHTGYTSSRVVGRRESGDGIDDGMALFTNPRGVYIASTGIWEAPRGRVWNGQAWIPPAKRAARKVVDQPEKTLARKGKQKAKALRVRRAALDDDSDDLEEEAPRKRNGKAKQIRRYDDSTEDEEEDEDSEYDDPPPVKKRKKARPKLKFVARRVLEVKTPAVKREAVPAAPVVVAPPATPAAPEPTVAAATSRYGGQRCYACGGEGHFADRCPDAEAKARNDAYLARRAERRGSPRNGGRAQ